MNKDNVLKDGWKVKPLEWRRYEEAGAVFWRAKKLFGGSYFIEELEDYLGWNGQAFGTLDEAKVAAQADYEQRVCSVLIEVPA
jgi:hypothetical protein